jgi:hypothetical protein
MLVPVSDFALVGDGGVFRSMPLQHLTVGSLQAASARIDELSLGPRETDLHQLAIGIH